MGGSGSGRHRGSGKDTTSAYRGLDIRRIQREGLLQPGKSFNWKWKRGGEVVASIDVRTELDCLRLFYQHRRNSGPWQVENYAVSVEWTACNYGGERAWFRCPARGCDRRVAILYMGADIFACRRCYRLAYDSQGEATHDRAMRRVYAIRTKLGGSTSVCEPFPAKPKGMHWRTYSELFRRAREAGALSCPPWLLPFLRRQSQAAK